MNRSFKTKIFKKSLLLWGSFFVLLFLIWFFQARPANAPQNFVDGYFYKNKDLGFAISLPASFKYFQTQRQKGDGFVEVEFFVPTSDRYHHQLVPGYARPFVIRLIKAKDWSDYEQNKKWQKIGQKQDRVYIISFWEKVPADWQDKWSTDLQKKIKKAVIIE